MADLTLRAINTRKIIDGAFGCSVLEKEKELIIPGVLDDICLDSNINSARGLYAFICITKVYLLGSLEITEEFYERNLIQLKDLLLKHIPDLTTPFEPRGYGLKI